MLFENYTGASLHANGRRLSVSSGGKASSLSYGFLLHRVVCLSVVFFLTITHFEENRNSKFVTGFPKCASQG